jgi:predicted Zn-dependent peptidase
MNKLIVCLALAAGWLALPAAAAESSALKMPPCQEVKLKNGLTLLLLEQHKVPLVSLAVTLRAGGVEDPDGQEGLASVTASLLKRGTGKHSADELAAELDFMGAAISFDADWDATQGGGEFLKKDLPAALDLFAEILRQPAFPEAEFTKLIQQAIDGLKQEKDEPGAVIGKYYRAFLYGAHPYARPVDGDENSLARLKREDVARFYARHYDPAAVTIVAAGDFTTADMARELAARFEDWAAPAEHQPPRSLPPPAPVKGRRLLLVDKPDATQTYFCLGNLGICATNEDRVAIQLVNTLFGGRFTSLLNESLRINSGYTYGARSSFTPASAAGPFVISSFTPNATTAPALDLALAELKKLRQQGLTGEQLASVKAYIKGQSPLRYETGRQLANVAAGLHFHGLDAREIDNFFQRLDAVTLEETRRIIQRYYPLDDLVFVLVGKAAEIKEAVAKYAPPEVRDIRQAGYR